MCVCEVAQSCPALCDPMDCSPSGSSVHGIFQARILQWVAISFSRGSSHPRDRTQVSCTAGVFFTTRPPGKPHRVVRGIRINSQPNAADLATQQHPHSGPAPATRPASNCPERCCRGLSQLPGPSPLPSRLGGPRSSPGGRCPRARFCGPTHPSFLTAAGAGEKAEAQGDK